MTDSTALATTATSTRRNALTTWLIPTVFFILAPPLGGLLGTTMFRFAPNAAILAGVLLTFASAGAMVREINAAAGSDLKAWHLLIPVYGLYWMAVLVPAQVAVAKQRAGKPPPRGLVVYLFLFLYALAADINDLAT
jgi:hypothetical protein